MLGAWRAGSSAWGHGGAGRLLLLRRPMATQGSEGSKPGAAHMLASIFGAGAAKNKEGAAKEGTATGVRAVCVFFFPLRLTPASGGRDTADPRRGRHL